MACNKCILEQMVKSFSGYTSYIIIASIYKEHRYHTLSYSDVVVRHTYRQLFAAALSTSHFLGPFKPRQLK